MPAILEGEDPPGVALMRTIARKVCRTVAKYPSLLMLITDNYPEVAVAISALVAACAASGFDQPNEKSSGGSSGFG